MPFAANHAEPKVEEAVAQFTRSMNASRYAPPLKPLAKKASDANKIYIFNVGPWEQHRFLGSLGQFHIPACPPDAKYSAPVVIDGIVREFYPINEAKCEPIDEEGWDVALQILGVGPHLSPRNSFVPYGVFLSRTPTPTEEDLSKARAALRETYRQLVQEADVAYSLGPKTADETIRPETHFVAARALGKTELDCVWLKNAVVPAERRECPGCGSKVKVGIVVCPTCKFILEKDLYKAADYAK